MHWWETDPILCAFKDKLHLNEVCSKCAHARECGGGCLIAREGGDPFKADGSISNEDVDYLAEL